MPPVAVLAGNRQAQYHAVKATPDDTNREDRISRTNPRWSFVLCVRRNTGLVQRHSETGSGSVSGPDQTRVFEEQNEIMRAQGSGSMPVPLRNLPPQPPVVVKARLWPLIPIAALFLISLAAVLYDRYAPVVKPTAQSEIASSPAVGQPNDEEITPAQAALLQRQMLSIPRPCTFRIVAPPGHLALRNLLSSMAAAYDADGIAACSVIDGAEDSAVQYVGPKPKYPTSGVSIFGPFEGQAGAEELKRAFTQIGIKIADKVDLASRPSQGIYPPDLIYISLGTGSLWK
jgi:hypothetical protein